MGHCVQWLSTAISFSLLFSFSIHTEAARDKSKSYVRSEIADARFGTGDRKKYLEASHGLARALNAKVFGQEVATAVIQDRFVQYFEGFPNRTGEPIILNFVGLPGIGKSAILEAIKAAGFPVAEFDSQNYLNGGFQEDLARAMERKGARENPPKPLIVFLEEIDKLAETTEKPAGSLGEKIAREATFSTIGTLNQISSEGKITSYGDAIRVSNVLFITTMNFSPAEIESFSREVLGSDKSFYDFTIEDFAKFNEWIRRSPGARYKILAKLFRSNTVSRAAPNTVIMNSLTPKTYRQIVESQVRRAIRHNTEGDNSGKRVTVEVDPSLIDFLAKETVYAPSGARETVFRSSALVEQLINIGIKSTGEHFGATDRPRHLRLSFNTSSKKAEVQATELVQVAGGTAPMREGERISVSVQYEPGARLFLADTEIAVVKPSYPQREAREEGVRPVTKKEIYQTRFPLGQTRTDGLRQKLSSSLFGQEQAIDILVTDFENYFGRVGPAKNEPSQRVLAGFPGIGKSELFLQAAEATGLPVQRINMQSILSGENPAKELATALMFNAPKLSEKYKDGRYLLLIEEFDKAFELDPSGKPVDRPILAVIKDILNNGRTELIGDYSGRTADLRNAFIGVTMNFAVDRFGFRADPRLTSIDDVFKTWENLSRSMSSIKSVLGSMFLPDTVSRLMTNLHIMRPLQAPHYRMILQQQVVAAKEARILDEKQRNIGQIEIKTSPSYMRYLVNEHVIPSEGARYTVKTGHLAVATDIEFAIQHLPRSSTFARAPIVLTLDYSEAKEQVRFQIHLQDDPNVSMRLDPRDVALKFPRISVRGRVKESRMHVAAHEFGHAYTALRLGRRFEHVVAVPPDNTMGGYVKLNDKGAFAADQLAMIYTALGSRAFERIVSSPDPLDPRSVLAISQGASMDIQVATMNLYNMLYELGHNPWGGTLDRNFMIGPGKYASYQDLPSSLAEKLGMILREIEDQIIRDTLASHPLDWYVERIVILAKKGAMTEAEFYELLGYKYPGKGDRGTGTRPEYFRQLFEQNLQRLTAEENAAGKARRGLNRLTSTENAESAVAFFTETLKKYLATPAPSDAMGGSCQALFEPIH